MPRPAAAPMIYGFGQRLRRRVWQPLHRMADTFHALPLIGAVLVFFILATVGQVGESYLSFLENLNGPRAGAFWSNVGAFAAALVGFTLLSAALYQSHYWLSSRRINILYSANSDPESGSTLRNLQRMAALGLALAPWFGLFFGLLSVKIYVAGRYSLLDHVITPPSALELMQHLPAASLASVLASIILLALAIGFFLDRFRHHAVLQGIAIFVVPFATLGLFLLLTDEPGPTFVAHKIVIALLFVVGSAVYYAGFAILRRMRSSFIYTQSIFPDMGVNWRLRQRIFTFAWSALPWLTLAICLALASGFSGERIFGFAAPADRWAVFPVAMICVTAIGLGVATLLDWLRETAALGAAIIACIAALAIANIAASCCDPHVVVRLFRMVGPLGTISSELLFLFSTFALLAILSQKSGFPALTLVMLAIVVSAVFPVPIWVTAYTLMGVCAILAAMAFVSRLWAVGGVALLLVLPGFITWLQPDMAPATPIAAAPEGLQSQFDTWLDARRSASARPDPLNYPVFILAVEGGGIYAASAASLLLAKLEDSNPGFAQHVFAISGVSGGAIGATVFQALDQSGSRAGSATPAPASAIVPPPFANGPSAGDGCPDYSHPASQGDASAGVMAQLVTNVMQDDHISPLVGAIFPELFGIPGASRAKAVAASFSFSVGCQDKSAGSELDGPYVKQWSATSGTPALILNTTWVETGSRVAFSPFPLHPSDQSMYSFSDQYMPGANSVSLIDAAVVSARFPAMLPPYSIIVNKSSNPVASDAEPLRWDFVDGGYSDNSGASTALGLYRELADHATTRHAPITIILLTSSNPQPDLRPDKVSINGAAFQDTLAPISAILKVREGLGNQAIARACEQLAKNQDCQRQEGASGSPLRFIEIEDQTYGLSLGFKISKTSFEVVKWMVGDASRCVDEKSAVSSERIVTRNSCTLKYVADLLSGKEAAPP